MFVLNEMQRKAVEHDGHALLIVAGAGTGKTTTLAARLARLIDKGADPARLLLLTFSRRAAHELDRPRRSPRRPERGGPGVGRHVPRRRPPPAATTRRVRRPAARLHRARRRRRRRPHGPGARRPRASARGERRFPRKDTLQSIYSRVANAQEPLSDTLANVLPVVPRRPRRRCAKCSPSTPRAQSARPTSSTSTTCCSTGARWRSAPPARTCSGMFDHVLVDEVQDVNTVQGDILAAHCWPRLRRDHRGRRRRAGHLRLPRRDTRCDVRLPRPFRRVPRSVTLEQNYRSIPPILTAANTMLEKAPQRLPAHAVDRPQRRPSAPPHSLRRRSNPGQRDLRRGARTAREQGVRAARPGRAVPHRPPQRRPRDRTRPAQHPVREVRRPQVPRDRARQGHARPAAHPRQPHRRAGVAPRVRSARRGRPGWARRIADDLGVTARTDTALKNVPRAGRRSAARRGRRTLIYCCKQCLGDCIGPPDPPPATQIERLLPFLDVAFERAYPYNATSRKGDVEAMVSMAGPHKTRGAFLADLAVDPPASTSDLAGPPHLDDDWLVLSTIHSAKGGEWQSRVRDARGRRQHPLRHGAGRARRRRRGTPPALRRHDESPRLAHHHLSAALLPPPPRQATTPTVGPTERDSSPAWPRCSTSRRVERPVTIAEFAPVDGPTQVAVSLHESLGA